MAASNAGERTAGADEAGVRRRWRAAAIAFARQEQTKMLVAMSCLLAVGIGLIWMTKSILGVEGDAIFITLLLVPLIVYLAFTGRISAFSFPGGSVAFTQLRDHVVQVGRLEPERTAYLGKLAQVHDETDGDFALLYADIDGLRQRTRDDYSDERRQYGQRPRPEGEGRQTEEAIRERFIRLLEFAFVDAFYDTHVKGGGKCDVFKLQEPDLIMILRGVGKDDAKEIASTACRYYSGWTNETVTAAVLPPKWPREVTPENIDRVAQESLDGAKDLRRGQVYVPDERKLRRRALAHGAS